MSPTFLLLSALAAPQSVAAPQAEVGLEQELERWAAARVRRVGAASAQYSGVLVDLDGDHAPEALVYLSGRDWCGSGGCNLYILQRQSGQWRLINSVTIAKLPIRQLATSNRGWSDIGVYVSGGGVIRGYEAVLRFNGRRYPGNPSMPPAFAAPKGAKGVTVIPRTAEAKPLIP